MNKKNVDEILKNLEISYAYNLAERDRIKKKNGVCSYGYDSYNSKVSFIEDVYCDILGLSSLDKSGKSLMRRLRKQAKRGPVYKYTRKLK